jgi:hypothetical protein
MNLRRCSEGLRLTPSIKCGGYRVAEYRAFTVGPDEHFMGLEPLFCADDAKAIAQAKLLADDHDIELWSRNRLVIRIKASRLSKRP